MSGDYEEDVCRSALRLVHELCSPPAPARPHARCLEFTDLLRHRGHPRPADTEVSVSLLSVIVTFCGLVLLGVSLFVSWKLCWVPWRHKGGPGGSPPRKEPPQSGGGPFGDPLPERGDPEPPPERCYLDMGPCPEGGGGRALGPPPGQGSLPSGPPPGPPEFGGDGGEGWGPCPAPPRSSSWGGWAAAPRSPPSPKTKPSRTRRTWAKSNPSSTATPAAETAGARGGPGATGAPSSPCGRLSVSLRYSYGSQQLVVRVLRARDLPAKDSNGFSDPYVKIYLLPDRKKKFQTKVLRRTLNPEWDETFSFGVPFGELPARRLHFGVYDFDRFSRHDLIGQVVLDNLLEAAEARPEVPIWRDIQEGSGEKADLGEVNFSLCYLPTAGRLTVTVIRASNLRAMDLTGYSDPYVKASLMAEGRRLKKRKTSIKKNTLNPNYNEALVFDVPHESVHHVSLTIAVVDYDCIGHNEVIGLCRVGSDADGPGREHWAQMLANPRKPIEHWHTLVEEKALTKGTARDKPALGEPLGPH
ncbi:LOW QUALITY PROTEIN: synaptotagmin-3 [Corvus hawaiiensis]|uniref:LOW QUALITY PROTEIN: synaptotagmin-3 n=1 Tax=Corvus hawaiiensis TaxID=134902 RepID=UPI002018BAE5|nr:LOW QUALITY PROTEIN: synaptotagmin-3 [Corvus hawaiiensis]